jgi:hypothetical protein
MPNWLWIGVLAGVLGGPWSSLAAGSGQGQAAPPPAVKVGDVAPDFTLTYLDPGKGDRPERKQVRLSDFKGKQNVVLAFFVAAFSPG